LALRDWLEALGARQVAMEVTGIYWKPVWAVLEDSFALTLVNALHVKAVPDERPTSRTPSACVSYRKRAVAGELCTAQADPHAA
jgi:hypothetical protein